MIRSAAPAPALRHLIRYYYQVDARVAGAIVQPVPARSPQALEFTLGTPYEVRRLQRGGAERAHPIALIGAQTFRRVDLVMRGAVDAFTVVFRPGGLAGLFGTPVEVLTNDHFDAEGVLGRRVHDLHGRLGHAAAFDERVSVANAFLSALGPSPCRRDPIAIAASFIHSRNGCVSVSALAEASGVGMRQFERRFQAKSGITPKLYCRIVRFEAALRLKAASAQMPWTDIAHALGYHDQMHMVHDFSSLSGGTPTAISDQLEMFVRPEVLSTSR